MIMWIKTVIPNTRVTAFIAVKNTIPKLVSSQGPIPISSMMINSPMMIMISGVQARRSDAEGIMVLLTVKTR